MSASVSARKNMQRISFKTSSGETGRATSLVASGGESSGGVVRRHHEQHVSELLQSNEQQMTVSRLQDRVRLLQDDLETERELRQRIDRDKADLSVHVIQLQERLEQAEAGVDGQLEINKKRDNELLKLRKLLEDVHLESEDNIHMMKKKHQEVVTDYIEQLEGMAKARARLDKEKVKLQQELYELLSQVETSGNEKAGLYKQCERLEVQVRQLTVKIEELNRTVVEITSQKTYLHQENVEIEKRLQETRVSLENVEMSRNQMQSSLNDCKRRLEEHDRRRSALESQLRSVEAEFESVRCQLAEESEARLQLDRQLVKSRADADNYKVKHDLLVTTHAEEIEEIRRKLSLKVQEQEEHMQSLMSKLSQVEKQKSRLHSELEVIIVDLEKSNASCRDAHKHAEHLERTCADVKNKMDELVRQYDQSVAENRDKAAEIGRLLAELDKMRAQNGELQRENRKLTDENQSVKAGMSELSRHYQELETELKQSEKDRSQLADLYKETESIRRDAESRCLSLSDELQHQRADTEKRLTVKEEQLESVRKTMTMEIEQLNVRVSDAETRLKSEVQRTKKKLQASLAEVEMSLDVANRNNIDLQRQLKKVSQQLTETATSYDDSQHQLHTALDQLAVLQRRVQTLTSECDELRSTNEQTLRLKTSAESQSEELRSRLHDMQTYSQGLATSKSKLEQQLATLTSEYDVIIRELKVFEEKLVVCESELQQTVTLLKEERQHVTKIETVKKSLEVEIRTLTVRVQEAETTATVNSKRTISKLESRIRDLEVEHDSERRRHAETLAALRKKERNVKELIIQMEEDQKNIQLLQETLDKTTQKMAMYKRQMHEQEQLSASSLSRVRRYQQELDIAEERAEHAESSLNMVRSKHRSLVTHTTSTAGGGGRITVVKETRTMQH